MAEGDISNNQQVVEPPAKKQKMRGSGYSRVEDLLVCKAFIAASEDPFVGTSMKGKDFQKKMHIAYVQLLQQQLKIDQLKYSSMPADAKEPEPTIYDERNGSSIYSRFKDTLSFRVQKFLAVVGQTQMDSGTTEEDYYQKCKLIYEKRYPAYGNFDDYKMCKEYLEDKPKYSNFCAMSEAAVKEKNLERPIGAKKAKQEEKDKKLIGDALKACGVDGKPTETPRVAVYEKALQLLDGFGNSMMQYWQSEQDNKMFQYLDTPEKKEFAREQFKLKLARAKLEHRKLTASDVSDVPDEVVTSTCSNTSSAT